MTFEKTEISLDDVPTEPLADTTPDDEDTGEASFIDLTDDFPTEE